MLLSTYYSDIHGKYANVVRENNSYSIEFFEHNAKIAHVNYNNSLQYVEDAAENWALGILKKDFLEKTYLKY